MLMPGQWPCIPNWHFDLVPRVKGKQDFSLIDPSKRMHLWLSGPPLTEFRSERGEIRQVEPRKWFTFTQMDEHRGVMATDHTWRVFIRVAPVELLPVAPQQSWIRRHSQVYLDAETFKW